MYQFKLSGNTIVCFTEYKDCSNNKAEFEQFKDNEFFLAINPRKSSYSTAMVIYAKPTYYYNNPTQDKEHHLPGINDVSYQKVYVEIILEYFKKLQHKELSGMVLGHEHDICNKCFIQVCVQSTSNFQGIIKPGSFFVIDDKFPFIDNSIFYYMTVKSKRTNSIQHYGTLNRRIFYSSGTLSIGKRKSIKHSKRKAFEYIEEQSDENYSYNNIEDNNMNNNNEKKSYHEDESEDVEESNEEEDEEEESEDNENSKDEDYNNSNKDDNNNSDKDDNSNKKKIIEINNNITSFYKRKKHINEDENELNNSVNNSLKQANTINKSIVSNHKEIETFKWNPPSEKIIKLHPLIGTWFEKYAKPQKLTKRKALLLYSDFPLLGKTEFAKRLCNDPSYHLFFQNKFTIPKNITIPPRLGILDNLNKIFTDKKTFRSLIAGKKTIIKEGGEEYLWNYEIPWIITTRNFDLVSMLYKCEELNKYITFVEIKEYLGPNDTKPKELIEENAWFSEKTWEFLNKDDEKGMLQKKVKANRNLNEEIEEDVDEEGNEEEEENEIK